MKTLTIGKVAKQAGIGVETIRFYERTGLLKEPPRNDSGYRQYPPEVVLKLRFIKKAKLDSDQVATLRAMHESRKHTIKEICSVFDISKPTFYRYLKMPK